MWRMGSAGTVQWPLPVRVVALGSSSAAKSQQPMCASVPLNTLDHRSRGKKRSTSVVYRSSLFLGPLRLRLWYAAFANSHVCD